MSGVLDHETVEAGLLPLDMCIGYLTEMLAGKQVTVAEVEPEGCLITRDERLKNKSEITFTKQVSLIAVSMPSIGETMSSET